MIAYHRRFSHCAVEQLLLLELLCQFLESRRLSELIPALKQLFLTAHSHWVEHILIPLQCFLSEFLHQLLIEFIDNIVIELSEVLAISSEELLSNEVSMSNCFLKSNISYEMVEVDKFVQKLEVWQMFRESPLQVSEEVASRSGPI